MRIYRHTIRRLVATMAVVTTAVVVGLVTPAFALWWIWIGPHPTFDACNADRIEFSNTYTTQPCQFRDLSGTIDDGWYFKYAPEFLTVGAAPAGAEEPRLRNVYYYYEDCQSYGYYGIKPGAMWDTFNCVWVPSAGSPTGGFWFLYAWWSY